MLEASGMGNNIWHFIGSDLLEMSTISQVSQKVAFPWITVLLRHFRDQALIDHTVD